MRATRNIALAISSVLLLLGAPLVASFLAGSANGEDVEAPEDVWGRIETFDEVLSGTAHDIAGLDLLPSSDTDLVFLDGSLWIMFRGNESREIARYSPSAPQTGWNISFEAFAPREGSAYYGVGKVPGRFSLIATIEDGDGGILAGIDLRISTVDQEGIYLNRGEGEWTKMVGDIEPALSRDTSTTGRSPDRYTIAFAYDGQFLNITVHHDRRGTLLMVQTVPIESATPVLHIKDVAVITPLPSASGDYGNNGGWMVDNLGARPTGTPYPRTSPILETVRQQDPVWMEIRDLRGNIIPDAEVKIGNVPAPFDSSLGRYLAPISRPVDWAAPMVYELNLSYLNMRGLIKVTTTAWDAYLSTAPWWNGWDWVTVFGLDDCVGPETAITHYSDFDHPATAYVMYQAGSSDLIQDSGTEIAMHGPHDYYTWMKKNWSESVQSAEQNQWTFKEIYTYASHWDAPAMGGAGDTYLSLANPGNTATYQMMFAQFAAGTRIEGISSNQYNGAPGNSTWLGSYYLYGPWNSDPWVGWVPLTSMDLMDMSRQWSTDNPTQSYEEVAQKFAMVAERSGVLRVYGHPEFPLWGYEYSNVTALLNYLVDVKSDGSPENWKATDGEVASYIYGSRTTGFRLNQSETGKGVLVYDVERKDPKAAGYWNVPVTLKLDMGGANVLEVKVVEDGKTYSSLGAGQEQLRRLDGVREMDWGYDVRDGLYVSHFWNGTSKLIIKLESPKILNMAPRVALLGEQYDFTAFASMADSGENIWALSGPQSPWLQIMSTSSSECLIAGTPSQIGSYDVSLSVTDADSVSYLNWTINVGDEPDLMAPNSMASLNGNASTWNRDAVEVTLMAEDIWSGVWRTEYYLDGEAWRTYAEPIFVSDQGWHRLHFRSIDNWGNQEPMRTVEFGIDVVAPQLRILTANGTLFPKGDALLALEGWDNESMLSTMVVSVDGMSVYQGPFVETLELPDLPAGELVVTVQVVDAAGNEALGTISMTVGALPAEPGVNGIIFFLGSAVFLLIIILVIQIAMSRKSE